MKSTILRTVIIMSILWSLSIPFPPGSVSAEADADKGGRAEPGIEKTQTEILLPIPATEEPKEPDNGQSASVNSKVHENKTEKTDPKAIEKKGEASVLDRRWIIKMNNDPISPAKKKEIVWANKSQQQRCEVLGSQLRDALRNVKHFTVRGDECSIARYAEQFLTLTDQCKKECPETFYADRGYNPEILRNARTLLGLGRKRCLGESAGQSSLKKADNPK